MVSGYCACGFPATKKCGICGLKLCGNCYDLHVSRCEPESEIIVPVILPKQEEPLSVVQAYQKKPVRPLVSK